MMKVIIALVVELIESELPGIREVRKIMKAMPIVNNETTHFCDFSTVKSVVLYMGVFLHLL